uniref:Glutamate/phenylalanine/leucine/valine/L-tryptophan dehydrogenase C-terminal domain-containing protein n=1 Tax=Strombidium inclinatum TaxID=197538 RepID=A0A7S3MYK7_9SPIT|mmetsp:Transcript_2993/g.4631  ORF Transcript_2993/g.4631 Transcript_2993/m.4631 type:complete len:190 (+) Transcript_2993:303-872(+)
MDKGTLEGYPKAELTETANPASFMERKVDYLIPAATEKSIHMENAPKIQARAVFEGGNGPTTFAGEEILQSRGIVVCPDLLVNGGGVTCSYFEWLKNISHVSPGKMTKKFDQQSQLKLIELIGISTEDIDIKGADEIDIVYSALDEIMTEATKDNWAYAMHHNLNFRDACLGNAMMKIYRMYQESGLTL